MNAEASESGEPRRNGKPDAISDGILPIALPVQIGTMGWSSEDWAGGVFYPPGAATRDYLRLYAQSFDSVEIDSTFYGTPGEARVLAWAQAVPDHFTFCPKAPRVLTHDMRLRDVIEPLAHFVRAMGLLGAKRGPMLLQMPPDFTRQELDNLHTFLPALTALLKELNDDTARFAIEFRHRSLLAPDVSRLLAAHNVALALTDYADMPRRFELTTDWTYLRLIGRHGDYPRHDKPYGDRSRHMQTWVDALRAHAPRLKAAYVQCNNDYEGYSPATANKLKQMLGLPVRANPAPAQGSLF